MLSPHSQQLHSSSIGFYEHKGKFQLNTVQVILSYITLNIAVPMGYIIYKENSKNRKLASSLLPHHAYWITTLFYVTGTQIMLWHLWEMNSLSKNLQWSREAQMMYNLSLFIHATYLKLKNWHSHHRIILNSTSKAIIYVIPLILFLFTHLLIFCQFPSHFPRHCFFPLHSNLPTTKV